jgi:hypothetical protein
MSNRSELRARVRQELGDASAPYLWSDTLLDSLLVEAGEWYSRLWPMQGVAYDDAANGQRVFALPEGATDVVAVECPPGVVLAHESPGPIGISPASGGTRQSWGVWAGSLYLGRPASGAEVGTATLLVRFLGPWARLDPIEQWNGPYADERLLVLWAVAQAWAWLEAQEEKRGRPPRPAYASATARANAQLEVEIGARRRAAGSRRIERD